MLYRLPLCVKLTSMAAHWSGKNPKQQELWSSKQHLFKNTKHAHRVKIRHQVAGRAFLDASFLLFVAIIKKQLCCQMPLLFLFIYLIRLIQFFIPPFLAWRNIKKKWEFLYWGEMGHLQIVTWFLFKIKFTVYLYILSH